jgi:hypothetical protein
VKNTHSIRLYDFVDEPKGTVLFDAALPLVNGQELSVPIEYDPETRYFTSCNVELPPRQLAAIKKVAEKPIRDELYRNIVHNLFMGAELTVPMPR